MSGYQLKSEGRGCGQRQPSHDTPRACPERADLLDQPGWQVNHACRTSDAVRAPWPAAERFQNAQLLQLAAKGACILGNQITQSVIATARPRIDGRRLGTRPTLPIGVLQRQPKGAEGELSVPPLTEAAEKKLFGVPGRKAYVFILGTDPRKSKNKFYKAAAKHFARTLPDAVIVKDRRTLADVFAYLREQKGRASAIYLVSHATADGVLTIPLKKGDKDRRVDYAELLSAIEKLPELFKLSGQIDEETTIYVKGCNIGRSKRMVELLDRAFGGHGTVVAPTHRIGYKYWEGMTWEFLRGYFLEIPGPARLSRAQQLKMFKEKYPHLNEKTWTKLLPKKGAARRVQTIPYTYSDYLPPRGKAVDYANRVWLRKEKYRAIKLISMEPRESGEDIDYVYTFKVVSRTNRGETMTWEVTKPIPKKETILSDALQWAKDQLARPEAYRWKVAVSRLEGPKVYAKVIGQSTTYTIDHPLRKEGTRARWSGYLAPETSEGTYYTTSTFKP